MVEVEMIDEAADAARGAAEARRQKMLESAQDRMNLIEGTTPSSSSTVSTHPSSPDEPDAATADDDPGSAAAGQTSTAASRMAAMRRRRFKSKQQDTTSATTSKVEAETTGAKTAAGKAKDSDDEKEPSAPDDPVEVQEEKEQTKPEEIQKHAEETREPSVMVSADPDKDTTGVDEPKKKYQGVAKMRRRMLKEKHQAQEDQSDTAKTSTSDAPAVSKKLAKAQVSGKPPLMPILMHAVTVLLLFLAGLDVGLQQSSIDYYGGALLTVHTELAPRRQLGGMAVVQKWIGGGIGTMDRDNYSSTASPNRILPDESYEDAGTLHDHDEFADVLTDDGKTGATESNIDPLFRVDLDKVTQGPGILLMMGRFAVRVHRLNLAIFWYGPRTFFFGVADWLLSLTTTPPILCLTAVVIRQFVGKTLLGAHLPPRVEDEKQHKDVMSTIKLFLSNIVLRSFPNVVRLYDVFSHVRADMYILLCGLFVGMAISHSAGGSSAALEESEPPASTEGISDEL